MKYIHIEKEDRKSFGPAFRDMPDVPASELVEVRETFVNRIFYSREGNLVRGRCSCCGKEMIARRELAGSGDLLEDLWLARDKEKGNCPECGQEVVYRAAGRFKDFSTLESYNNVIFILPINNGQTVFFRCYTVFANYWEGGPSKLCFVEKAHYRLSPGEWHMERRSFPIYDYVCWNTLACFNGHYSSAYEIGPWEERKRPCDPWITCMWYSPFYTFMNSECIEHTFLKYCRLDDFNRLRPRRGSAYAYNDGGEYGSTKLMAYLCYYAKYPALEIALRTKGGEAARDLIYSHMRNARVVNWKAKNPLAFWRLTKEEYRATDRLEDRFEFLRACKPYVGRLPLKDLVDMYLNGERQVRVFFEILDILGQEKPARVLKYCNAHSREYFGFYKDYLEAARAIGRDLGVHNVRFPKDLIRAHDEAVAARDYMQNEKKYAEWEKKARKYAKNDADRRKFYDFTEGEYFVRVAKDGAEIVQEGNELHHCVGGYVDRHVTCKTTILVLRKTAEPTRPFYTVEMRDGKLQQVHGMRNCAIHGAAKEFFDRWLLWLQAGGGSVKQKGSAVSAERQAV